MAKGISKMKDISPALSSNSSETDKQVGYLLRAVEDLADNLNAHMDKEEDERREAKKDFSVYQEEDRAEKREMKAQIAQLTTGLSDLKKYIFFVVLSIGGAGVALDKLELSQLTALFNALAKLFL